jgi:transcriptional regulator with XRE-family HTH domain
MKLRGKKLDELLQRPLVREGFEMQQARSRLGALLKRTREATGLSQTELGAICSVDQGNISKYETGAAGLTFETYVRLMHAQGYRVRIENVPIKPGKRKPQEPEPEDGLFEVI